ncbi:hypothetical protein SCHPADRAFT_696692 [Schizopora paradoxa]|uniref:Uncharacterized protein n=1 Tax=Schizopora paradoxa TaxID=27342 RepID=A0A0H2R328_9AGAM|nr:hypothetical protein SCHPADRAFT_696692 [Schizopora paradoxa]
MATDRLASSQNTPNSPPIAPEPLPKPLQNYASGRLELTQSTGSTSRVRDRLTSRSTSMSQNPRSGSATPNNPATIPGHNSGGQSARFRRDSDLILEENLVEIPDPVYRDSTRFCQNRARSRISSGAAS